MKNNEKWNNANAVIMGWVGHWGVSLTRYICGRYQASRDNLNFEFKQASITLVIRWQLLCVCGWPIVGKFIFFLFTSETTKMCKRHSKNVLGEY